MASETRLETLKRYYVEELISRDGSLIYLDDLSVSIKMEEAKPEYKMPTVMKGFENA